MSHLANLVAAACVNRQNKLDGALSAIRSYSRAVAAEAELPGISDARRAWCRALVVRLDAAWSALDSIRWDHGPSFEMPPGT